MSAYDSIGPLECSITDYSLERREADTSSDFTRVTTVISLHGEGETGVGEDVTYAPEDHDALLSSGSRLPIEGTYTIDEFSEAIGSIDLFPGGEPAFPLSRSFRQWGFESAALDLALRQGMTDLATVVDRTYDPIRFVASTRLGEPPSLDRIESIRKLNSACEFKLDPTADWSSTLIDRLAETATVRILDFKGRYDAETVDVAGKAGPDVYRLLLEAFPNAYVEDPLDDPDVEDVLTDRNAAVSWDYPIRRVEDVRSRPSRPAAINIKPSRFGSVRSLLTTIEYCLDRGISLYGGGQFELDVGRRHIQLLASLFYPDGPNDVAPRGYNLPTVPESLPTSPLDPPTDPIGIG